MHCIALLAMVPCHFENYAQDQQLHLVMSTTTTLHAQTLQEGSQRHQWSPYVVNGGTAMAIGGKGFCIVGADTRMSQGYSIMSRTQPKVAQLTSKCVIASCGMQADRDTFQKKMKAAVTQYRQKHGHEISAPAVSQLVSTNLYYRRFFPFYTFNLVAGVDEEGEGCVFGYDAIGSFQRVQYGVQGSGSALATSLFDNQILCETHPGNRKEITKQAAIDMIKDAFTSVGERDIYTGDQVDIFIITPQGTTTETFQLKRD